MEKEIIFLVEESPEGEYETRALGYSIFTQADTFDELKEEIRDERKLLTYEVNKFLNINNLR